MKTIITILLLALAISAGSAQDKAKKMSALDQPRYKENPIYLFFESYIQDVIGHLPEAKAKGIQEMNLQKVFNTKGEDWREVIRETLHLSDTIDVAIKDLWYKNRKHFKGVDGRIDPIWFSQVFTDKYMAEETKVDVWGPGELDAAKERIRVAEQNKKAEQNGAGNPLPAPETKSLDKKTPTKKSDGRSQ